MPVQKLDISNLVVTSFAEGQVAAQLSLQSNFSSDFGVALEHDS